MVRRGTPIAAVEGVFNAVVAEGDFVGRVVLEGRGAGAFPLLRPHRRDGGVDRRQSRREVARREIAGNIKLGPGGIREIEFIAQVFQLIRGGRDAALRRQPTLEVLALLQERNLLPADAVALLKLEGEWLRPMAIDGLMPDTLGRRFRLAEHPRFAQLLAAGQAANAQDLRTVAELLQRELRRAGFRGQAAHGVWEPPHTVGAALVRRALGATAGATGKGTFTAMV